MIKNNIDFKTLIDGLLDIYCALYNGNGYEWTKEGYPKIIKSIFKDPSIWYEYAEEKISSKNDVPDIENDLVFQSFDTTVREEP